MPLKQALVLINSKDVEKDSFPSLGVSPHREQLKGVKDISVG